MSVVTDIADAVVSELNTGIFSLAFTAEMALQPSFELKDLETLRVTIVPKSQNFQRVNRAGSNRNVEIDIGVMRKVIDDNDAKPLFALVEEIADYFDGKRPTDYERVICQQIENDPIYDPEHMRQYSQFTSVLTLSFKVL